MDIYILGLFLVDWEPSLWKSSSKSPSTANKNESTEAFETGPMATRHTAAGAMKTTSFPA